MELTVEVRREENDHYTAEITAADRVELTGRITEARTLSELVDYLEDLLRVCLEDDSVRLATDRLHLGTVRVYAERNG